MTEPTPENTYTVPFDALRPDPAEVSLDAADVAGYFLAAADAADGELPGDVLASIPLEDVVRLLVAALRVGGSLVRQVEGTREYLTSLAAELRAEGAG